MKFNFKRVVAFLLLAIMLLASVSCGNTSVDTDTDTSNDTSADISTDTSTGNNGSTQNPSYNPVITPDRIKYTATYNAAGTKINYGKQTLQAPELGKFYHNYEAAISMTFDDGDNVQTGHILNELFAKYGFKGTLMVCAGNVKNNADEWNTIISKGYLDIGCHGYDHVDPRTINDEATLTKETKEAVELLRELFPTQKVLTFAAPLAFTTDAYEAALKELVISNRLEQGGNKVIYGENYNMYRIQASSFNMGKTLDYINAQADAAVKNGTWLTELMHGVIDGTRYNTDIDKATFTQHCEYLYKKYNGKVWFGSFEEVSLYVYQYENSKLEYVACDKDSMTFKITTDASLDKSIYNIPMSAKVYLPTSASSAYYVINGVEYDAKVEKLGERKRYVNLFDIPTDGTEVKLYFSGNSDVSNGCFMHNYVVSNTVESTCTKHGYVELECTYCHNKYKRSYTDLHNYAEEMEFDGAIYEKCSDCDAMRKKEDK
ncbi:MAG: polysaccharide deacetylase family protein [Clostridia bacterium]|nr:polysaccharide deacetylase family protein [Clostridia bacterium]